MSHKTSHISFNSSAASLSEYLCSLNQCLNTSVMHLVYCLFKQRDPNYVPRWSSSYCIYVSSSTTVTRDMLSCIGHQWVWAPVPPFLLGTSIACPNNIIFLASTSKEHQCHTGLNFFFRFLSEFAILIFMQSVHINIEGCFTDYLQLWTFIRSDKGFAYMCHISS